MNSAPITVVETDNFLSKAKRLLDDEEKSQLVNYLAEDPEAGDIIPDTGGIRKVRWARQGGGKSGGYRAVYYYYNETIPLFAISIYAKKEKENLTQAEKNALKKLAALLARYGR